MRFNLKTAYHREESNGAIFVCCSTRGQESCFARLSPLRARPPKPTPLLRLPSHAPVSSKSKSNPDRSPRARGPPVYVKSGSKNRQCKLKTNNDSSLNLLEQGGREGKNSENKQQEKLRQGSGSSCLCVDTTL